MNASEFYFESERALVLSDEIKRDIEKNESTIEKLTVRNIFLKRRLCEVQNHANAMKKAHEKLKENRDNG